MSTSLLVKSVGGAEGFKVDAVIEAWKTTNKTIRFLRVPACTDTRIYYLPPSLSPSPLLPSLPPSPQTKQKHKSKNISPNKKSSDMFGARRVFCSAV